MRLIDLDPWFVIAGDDNTIIGYELNPPITFDEAQGIWFDLPNNKTSILIWFDGRDTPPALLPKARWQVSGTSMEDLTIHPSIDVKAGEHSWHGWVRNGETIDA